MNGYDIIISIFIIYIFIKFFLYIIHCDNAQTFIIAEPINTNPLYKTKKHNNNNLFILLKENETNHDLEQQNQQTNQEICQEQYQEIGQEQNREKFTQSDIDYMKIMGNGYDDRNPIGLINPPRLGPLHTNIQFPYRITNCPKTFYALFDTEPYVLEINKSIPTC
jgi:hypothetical protein